MQKLKFHIDKILPVTWSQPPCSSSSVLAAQHPYYLATDADEKWQIMLRLVKENCTIILDPPTHVELKATAFQYRQSNALTLSHWG